MIRMKITLVGCGAMGGALYQAWQPFFDVNIIRKDNAPSDIAPLLEKDLQAYACQVLVFAVKPSVLPFVAPLYGPLCKRFQPTVVSVAAGGEIKKLSQYLGGYTHIIRAMPNLPVAIGQGVTGLYAPPPLSSPHKQHVETLFRKTGIYSWLDKEEQLDAITALCGSAPAYYYLIVEKMMHLACEAGFSKQQAQELAQHVFTGAASYLQASQRSAEDLRRSVTSPQGTTAAALDVLERNDALYTLLQEASNAAITRAKTLLQ